MNVITWQATLDGSNLTATIDLCKQHSADGATLPASLPRPVSVSHGLHAGGACAACEAAETAADEATLANNSAPREERIAAAARLCRIADEEQACEGDSRLTWYASAEQIGTIETMRQACGGRPTDADWKIFSFSY